MTPPASFLITPLSRESIARIVITPLRVSPAKITATRNTTPFSVIARLVITSLALLCALGSPLSAQNVGDFILPEKTASTGRITNRYWPKGASTLWGTNSSSLPARIVVGTGLSLSGSPLTLTATGGGSGGATTLDELTDVTITSAATGQVLRYNGTAWVNYTHSFLTSSDLSGYLTTSTAASTYAPLASPTFTGTVTIPSGASISGYATTAALASGYQPLNAKLTSFSALANSAGVLTNDGSGTFSYSDPQPANSTPLADMNNARAHIHAALGNDATLTGSPAAPYATAQAAYDDGYRVLVIMAGNAGTLDVDGLGSGQDLWIYGGAAAHFLGTTAAPNSPIPAFDSPTHRSVITVRNNDVTTDHIHIYSDKQVVINLTGLDSTGTGCEMQVFNGIVGTVSILGAAGETNLDDDIGTEKDGNIGGTVLLHNCILLGPTSLAGGAAGEDITGPGSVGAGGTITAFHSTLEGTYDWGAIAAVNSTIAGSPPGTTEYYNCVVNGVPRGTIANGDKGSITTNGLGTTWTIDAGAVTNAMLAGSIDLTTKVTGILPPANMGTGSSISTKYLRGDGTWQTISGGGDALTSGTLAQFAATTSAELRGVLSDESGTGVFLTANGNGSALTGITHTQVSGLGTLATQSATISDYLTSATAASTYQPLDADLTTYAGITPAANVQSLLGAADYSAMRSQLGLVIGTDVQAWDADLDDLADGSLTGTLVAAASTSARGSVELATDGETSASVAVQGNDTRLVNAGKVEIGLAISDETTALTTGTAKLTFRMPHAMTLTEVRLSLTTVSSSGTPTVDINEAGTSVLSTKLTCDASEKTSTTAATAAVISDSSLADDAEITIDIDTAGTGATGAKVWLIGTR